MKSGMNFKKFPLTPAISKRSRLVLLAGDETRLRILCFMSKYSKACVSDIAENLDMSLAAISHHLRIMRDNGFFVTERMGNNICYTLVKNNFTRRLQKVICEA